MTQKELAAAVSVSRDSILRWEGGADVPSARMAANLSIKLGVTIAYLVGLSPRPTRSPHVAEELELVDIYRACSTSARKALLETARDVLKLEKRVGKKNGKNGSSSRESA